MAWWQYLGISNILSEGGIIAQAMMVIVKIQTHGRKKAVLGAVFALRIVSVFSRYFDPFLYCSSNSYAVQGHRRHLDPTDLRIQNRPPRGCYVRHLACRGRDAIGPVP